MQALMILAGTLLAGTIAGAGICLLILRRQLSAAIQEARSEISVVRADVSLVRAEWQQRDRETVRPGPPKNGFNLNRRAEAVRRLHSRHSLDSVIAGTGWSIPEISLLEKIERIVCEGRN